MYFWSESLLGLSHCFLFSLPSNLFLFKCVSLLTFLNVIHSSFSWCECSVCFDQTSLTILSDLSSVFPSAELLFICTVPSPDCCVWKSLEINSLIHAQNCQLAPTILPLPERQRSHISSFWCSIWTLTEGCDHLQGFTHSTAVARLDLSQLSTFSTQLTDTNNCN